MSKPSMLILAKLAPAIFVVLWATGFIGAKYGMRSAEPFTFLAIRFAIASAILLPVAYWFSKADLRNVSELMHSFFAGCLIHGLYLGGVFFAIDRGLAAGVSSLVVSLQPFLTVVFGFLLLKEKVPLRKLLWFGFAVIGVLLVLFPELDFGKSLPGITFFNMLACFLAVIGIAFGSVYQKRFVANISLPASASFQFIGAMFVTGICAFLFETEEIIWNADTIFAMLWLVIVLSIGAVVLLMYLIRLGSSSSVASLFFLVPVVSMLMAWVLFNETLATMQIVGSAIVVASVAFASRS